MRIVIDYQGKTYEGAESDDFTRDEMFDDLYRAFTHADKISFDLANGGKLMLGKEALRKAAIVVMP